MVRLVINSEGKVEEKEKKDKVAEVQEWEKVTAQNILKSPMT